MAAILYPLTTEKAVSLIERSNCIVLIVDKAASKPAIKQEAERLYGVKVSSVNVVNGFNGRKKAVLKFAKAGAAADIASRLKII